VTPGGAKRGQVVVLLLLAAAKSLDACAAEAPATHRRRDPGASAWTFALNAYPTAVRGDDDYTSVIGTADRGPLHLEARYNYESIGARSAFVGWSFAGGESLTWQVTPIAGGAWGTTKSFVAGVEASVAWRSIDFYVEAEYVPTRSREDSFTYSWSELGWRAVPWLRLGLAAQRTRARESDNAFQRGPFVQFTWQAVTLGGYWFDPGSNDQVFVGAIGVSF
jgi:hypothetical protein